MKRRLAHKEYVQQQWAEAYHLLVLQWFNWPESPHLARARQVAEAELLAALEEFAA